MKDVTWSDCPGALREIAPLAPIGLAPLMIQAADALEAQAAQLAANARRIEELAACIRDLLHAEYADLGDFVYQVREREGQGWDGPAVKAWSAAVERAKAIDAAMKGEG